MPYDLSDPNFNFAGQEEIIIRALRDATKQRATPFNEGVGAGRSFRASGADPGAFLSRAAGQINQQRAEQERMALGSEQQRRYGDLSRQLNTPGEVDYADPNSMVADNARRMELASQMGGLNLPQAQKMAQAYLTKGVNFPEAVAKMQSDRIERGEQNAMRLQEIEAQKARDAANQLIRDRERAQDRQDNIRLAASLRQPAAPHQRQTVTTDQGVLEWDGTKWSPIKVGDNVAMKAPTGSGKGMSAQTEKNLNATKTLLDTVNTGLGMVDSSSGMGSVVPNVIRQLYTSPETKVADATIGQLGAEKAHEMYGAAFTKPEMARAGKFIPSDGDTQEMTKWKLAQMKILLEKKEATLTGRPDPYPDVHNDIIAPLRRGEVPVARGQAASGKITPVGQPSAADVEARKWADANPNDPRAAAIRKKLGGM